MAVCGPASAGEITNIGGAIPPSEFGSIDVGTNTLYCVNNPAGTAKVYGDISMTLLGTHGHTFFAVYGTATMAPGERLQMSAEYTLNYSGTGHGVITNTGFFQAFGSLPEMYSFQGPVSQTHTASLVSTPAATNMTGVFHAQVDVDWFGISGDTIAVHIPQQSLDYSVVPEPATVCILALGGLALLKRRKK
jgi:hypothetical protein